MGCVGCVACSSHVALQLRAQWASTPDYLRHKVFGGEAVPGPGTDTDVGPGQRRNGHR